MKTGSGFWRRFYRGLCRVRQDNLCCYCGCEMDDTVHGTPAEQRKHPRAATIEHTYPNGHPLRAGNKRHWAAACYGCNQREGNRWNTYRNACFVASTKNQMAATDGTAAPTRWASPPPFELARMSRSIGGYLPELTQAWISRDGRYSRPASTGDASTQTTCEGCEKSTPTRSATPPKVAVRS